jgi:hypothetical protein
MTKQLNYHEWNGQRYPRVTSILSKGIPKPGLIRWAGRFVAEGAVLQADKWLDMSDVEAIEYLAGLPDRRRNSSANLGSAIHAAVDAVANDKEYEQQTDAAQQYVNGFFKFVEDFKPTFLLTEQPVFNRTHGYAGTLDAVVRIGRTNYVLDTKTGNRIYPEVALQLTAYKNAEFIGREGGEEVELPVIKKGAVLHLGPNTYSFIEARVDDEIFDAFLAVKDVYYWSEGLSKVALRSEIVPRGQRVER